MRLASQVFFCCLVCRQAYSVQLENIAIEITAGVTFLAKKREVPSGRFFS